MQTTLCQITAQYYENYAAQNEDWDGKKQGWKAKGGQIFEIMVDSDDFLYCEDVCIETIKDLLAAGSDLRYKYEYVSHELIFCTPIKLNSAQFELIFTEKAKAKYQSELVDEKRRETTLGKIIDEGDYEIDFE